MAVGQGVGDGEFLHAGRPCLLDNADIGDIVAGHGVEANPELFRVPGGTVGLQNPPGQGTGTAFGGGDGSLRLGTFFGEEDAFFMERYHKLDLLFSAGRGKTKAPSDVPS